MATNYRKFIIIGTGRTGSTALIQNLGNHPNVRMNDEVFRDLDIKKKYKDVISELFSDKFPPHKRAVGFKLFYSHPHTHFLNENGIWEGFLPELWDHFTSDTSYKIIHIKRDNLLRRYVSQKIAESTNIWSQSKSSKKKISLEDRSLKLSVGEIIREIEAMGRCYKKFDQLFAKHTVLEITYESLVSNKAEKMFSVCKHLEIPYINTTIDMKKQNPEPLNKLIKNYKSLLKEFEGTTFERFFYGEV